MRYTNRRLLYFTLLYFTRETQHEFTNMSVYGMISVKFLGCGFF